jgi:ubiquinone/menaquinone biosynthesis C-methylase UbiE
MLALAAARGITVVQGVAEALPFAPASFDHVLVVTTICFVDAPAHMLAETNRMRRPGGSLVVGLVDRQSPLGQDYLAHQAQNVFYREATFYSATEVERLALRAGFAIDACGQTLSRPLAETRAIEPLQPGRGRCGFVVLAARKAR